MSSYRSLSSLLAVFLLQPASPVHAVDACEQPAGRFVAIEGAVEVQGAEGQGWRAAKLDHRLCEGDTIRVGEHSRAAIYLVNEAVLRIDQNTTMRLLDLSEEAEQRTLLEIIKGAFHSMSRQPRRLTVNTPYLNGMIEGTEFLVRVENDRASLSVLEGKVLASNAAGSLKLAPGESATAAAGQAPQLRTLVRPRDAVAWSLYYPPILAVLGGHAGGASVSPALSEALKRAGSGDSGAAFQALDRIAENDRDASFYLHRAALLLSVGSVTEARADIDGALKRDANAGLAYALRSVIHVVQNEREPAFADAERAVSLSPTAAAKIALSYAQQADFRIEAARDTLLAAVQQHPGDALAWARLGELWLMLGERDKAREAAGKATSLAPGLARTQLVLGFAALAEFRNNEARAAFERAIALSSADPLAHLGLGLAKISDGDLAEGRQEIEVATGLDSNSALLRAYLGKAYFEEKRDPLDAQQYSIAKELDPNDPTAYLYDGILKQTLNRPVEALHDIAASIERNDNRAVYRGRLLLDQDRAARGTSLARVYKDLGFERLGIYESAQSLAVDPSNASAHRFLSDAYRSVRRQEISRVSELLQAQLLQDININPVQPSIAETNLNIVTLGGPGTPSLDEFTPLFQRNETQFNVSGFGGDNDTYGGEGVVSGLYDRFSYSAGAFSYDTDGFRSNNDLSHRIYDLYGQAAVTPRFNVQTELRRHETKSGDLVLNFDPEDFLSNLRRDFEENTARFGARYSPSQSSNVLFSFIYSDRKENGNFTEDLELFPGFSLPLFTKLRTEEDAYQVEGQYLFQGSGFNIITGLTYANVGQDLINKVRLDDFDPFTLRFTPDINDYRGYVYTNINLPAPVTWTLGLSYQNYGEDAFDVSRFNPKVGVQWHVTDTLRLRAAFFKTVKPALASNRTIEPTQIAGFNQYFDDANATNSTRYAGGLDWRVTQDLYVGGELTERDFNQPQFFVDSEGERVANFEDRNEWLHRAYLYWTPSDRWVFRAETVYDRYESEEDALDFNRPREVKTFSVPIGAQYFDPSGFFGGVGMTFVDQEVERSEFSALAEGDNSFIVADLAVGYRLPRRMGVVSIAVQNLLDKEFKYQDDTFREFRDGVSVGPYIPDRMLMGRITLNF